MKKVVACTLFLLLLLCGCSAQSSQLSYEDVESAGYQAIDAAKQYMEGEINQSEAQKTVLESIKITKEFVKQNAVLDGEDASLKYLKRLRAEKITDELSELNSNIESDNISGIKDNVKALNDLIQQRGGASSAEDTESTASDTSDTASEASDSGAASQTQSQSSAPQTSQPAASQAPQQSAPQSSSSQAQASEPQSVAPSQPSDGTTTGQRNALQQAKSYLKYSAFSYNGLIKQLKYEKFTSSQAQYGADNCGANWNEQAAKCAEQYLKYSAFSRERLISQLEYEGFTHEQAVYGASQNGY